MGIRYDDYISYGAGKIAWEEASKNVRWGNKTYSDIVYYDLELGVKRKLVSKTNYFSPAFSPDGKQVAVVQVAEDQKSNIVILDASTGQKIKEISNTDQYFLSRAVWTEEGKQVISIAKKNGKLALIKFSVEGEDKVQLTPWTSHTMESPSVQKDRVFFNASFDGIDNVFYTDLQGSNKIFQVSSVPVGAYEPQPMIFENGILFAEFTNKGYVLSKQYFTPEMETNNPISITEPVDMKMYDNAAIYQEGEDVLQKIEVTKQETFKTKKYNGIFRGQRIYSWGFDGLTGGNNYVGLSVKSVNLLNNLAFELASGGNSNEKYATTSKIEVDFARFYPIFKFTASTGGRKTSSMYFSNAEFLEQRLGALTYLPLEGIFGNYFGSIKPYAGFNYANVKDFMFPDRTSGSFSFNDIQAGLEMSYLKRTALQNINPRWGFSIKTNYQKVLSTTQGEQIRAKANLFFPGLFDSHNIMVSLGFQQENLTNAYQYSDQFEYSRGYQSIPYNNRAVRYAIDYQLPIVYPDAPIIRHVAYLQRIRANVFYDGCDMINDVTQKKYYQHSAGVEILLDLKWFNTIPMSLGIRKGALLNNTIGNQEADQVFLSLGF